MSRNSIIGKNLTELEQIIASIGFDIIYAKTLATNIYRRRMVCFSNMENLPKRLRTELNNQYTISRLHSEKAQVSSDGTVKYLFKTAQGNPFEMAYIPGSKRNTLCISTQSGCRMGCSFCHTGKLGLFENLSASDIVLQVMFAAQSNPVNRIVLMGMGEPLDNSIEVFKALEILNASWGLAFGASKITLSTIGIMDKLPALIGLEQCNLAISMHSPFAKERAEIVPAELTNPLDQTIELLAKKKLGRKLRLSFEYVVIPGENDTPLHAEETARKLLPLKCHVNVIPLNAVLSGKKDELAAKKFRSALVNLGLPATLRESRGYDINAACGMLAGRRIDVEL